MLKNKPSQQLNSKINAQIKKYPNLMPIVWLVYFTETLEKNGFMSY